MKKSYFIIAVILIVLSMSSTFAYATDYYDEVSPRYSYIMSIVPVLVIDDDGNSAASIHVSPSDMDAVDRVTATVTIRNLNTGNAVATWRDKPFSFSQLAAMYMLDLEYRLSTPGRYMLEASISLYDGSILRERVNVTSNVVSF